MDIVKLTLGKKVYTNLSGEQAALKIHLHNAMKNIPAYMSGYAKEIEHMTPRTSSFNELPSDFLELKERGNKAILLKGPKGNGKSNFVKIGGLAEFMKEMEKHQIKISKFEPCGISDMHTMIDRNGKTHVFSEIPNFELTRINPIDELQSPYKVPEMTPEQKERLAKFFEINPPKLIFPESGVGKTPIAPKEIELLPSPNKAKFLDPEIAKKLNKDK